MTENTTTLRPDSGVVAAGRASEPGAPWNVPLMPASNFSVGGLASGRALAFASGMATIAAVFDQVHAGPMGVLPDDCSQGVAGLVMAGSERGRWAVRRVGLDDTAGWIDARWTSARRSHCSPPRHSPEAMPTCWRACESPLRVNLGSARPSAVPPATAIGHFALE